MTTSLARTVLVGCLATVLALLPFAAVAQTDDDTPTDDAPADDPDGGDDPDGQDGGGAGGDEAQDEAGDPLPIRASVRATAGFVPDVRFRGGGWGHGVGMSQYGAYAQAQAGRSAEQILRHYYSGTEVTTDDRSSGRRIRVQILDDINDEVESTTVEAVDGDVQWYACRPDTSAGEDTGGRVSDCTQDGWFVQEQGSILRVCPFREEDDQGDLIDGIRIVTSSGGDHDECEQDASKTTRNYSVARINHHGTTIRTPAHFSQTALYRHGWRDLHSRNGRLDVVQDVPNVELYLRGLGEVPSSWGQAGPAALRAQAITGRTYALRSLGMSSGCACDLRATPADQNYTGYSKEAGAYGELWVDAVDATTDRVLTYQGGLAETYYSSSHAGRSEHVEDSWAFGTTPVPYLRSVDDPWSVDPRAGNSRATWRASTDNANFAAFVSAGQDRELEHVERLRILSRTTGGTPREVEITGRGSGGDQHRFTFTRRPTDAGTNKPIAGASFRRFLPIDDGGTGGRLFSSQISHLGFAPFDDDDGTVHEFAIAWAAQAGIVRGVGDARFAPGRAVTRAQMATYLASTFDVPIGPPTGRFSDVAPGDTHAANIEALVDAGVANGYPDDTFRPDERVTRAQMATFLAQALDASTDTTGTFTDVDGGVHDASIEAIAELGITAGCDAERFCPGDPVQRGQLAAFVQRLVVGD